MAENRWWDEIEQIIQRYSLLKHPFYQAWQKGKLALEDLREYAKQYYPHVAAFPRYVSATHSVCGDLKIRQMLIENLVEEERGEDHHPELWLRFAEGLGMSRESVLGGSVPPATRRCIEVFHGLCCHGALSGLAALYAYESQIPAVCITKLEGLKKFYGIQDPSALQFFEVHRKADVWHSSSEREAIEALATDGAKKDQVRESVDLSCRAVWNLLDSVCEARGL